MNHPTEDQLLLLAYGELPERQASEIQSHIAACTVCAHQLVQLDRGRVALDMAVPARRRRPAIVRATVSLAAAAVIAAILLTGTRPSHDAPVRGWNPTPVWSATAGYLAGGNAMVDIDAQLTRLEQERFHDLPN